MNMAARQIIILIACAAFSLASSGAELLYVYSSSCPSCMRFERDVGRIYAKTEEAQRAPMIRLTIAELETHTLNACIADEVVGTPTFIMLNKCEELDRIVGYSTDELFWLGMHRMLNQIP